LLRGAVCGQKKAGETG